MILCDANGEERREIRTLPPDIQPLTAALQRMVDQDPETLEALRDSSIGGDAQERKRTFWQRIFGKKKKKKDDG